MADIPLGLYLNNNSALLAPLVPSIILDYFMRNSKEEYVVGTLLGIPNGNEIMITNCYGVPYREIRSDSNSMEGEKRNTQSIYVSFV